MLSEVVLSCLTRDNNRYASLKYTVAILVMINRLLHESVTVLIPSNHNLTTLIRSKNNVKNICAFTCVK